MNNYLLLFAVVLVILLCGFEKAFACTCLAMEKPTAEFRKTPVVFVGTVKAINSADSRIFGEEFNFHDTRTTFAVDESLKGVKGTEIDIYTSSQGSACGIRFEEGEKYLVYAYGGSDGKKYYTTSICSRTRLAADKEDEIAVLRSIARGNFEPRIYGRVEEIVRGIYLLDRKENLPMPNVRVIARGAGSTYQTTTDQEGKFRFVSLRPGDYKLEVVLPPTRKIGDDSWGYREKQAVDLNYTVTASDCPDFITIKTRVDGRIKGRVFDFQGKPVGKVVSLTLVTKETVNNSDSQIQYIGTDTNKDGVYEFVGIPEGEYYLGINLDLSQPYKNNPYPKTLYPNAQAAADATLIKLGYGQQLKGFDFTLPPPLKLISVKGKVRRIDGRPAAGVTVYVSNQARHDFEDFVWLKTDANGEFQADCLKGLTYSFAVFQTGSKGYEEKSAELIRKIDEQTVEPIEFVIGN